MRFNLLNRKVHYWATAFIALPLLVIVCTGSLLQLKKHWTWVQPEEKRGTGTAPAIDLDAILASVKTVPALEVDSWDDVNRIDLRPSRGMAKVWLRSGWEVQVDLGTGKVLQTAYRRSDLIESIHDGSFFAGEWSKLGIFFPAAIVLLIMWITGVWMFLWPFIAKWKRKRAALALLLSLAVPAAAAPKRRAVQHPAPLTRAAIIAEASRMADRVEWSFHPRLHWENAVYFDGLVLFGEQVGGRNRFLDRAADVILHSDDPIETVYWGDGTAFAQAAMDLHRVLPPGDPRREAVLQTLSGPMRFAEHAIRGTREGAPRDPWWIPGGYGARFWQDDLYMVVPWLALYGSTQDGLPGNELARNLAYEWIEAYVHEHRPPAEAAVPSSRARRGFLLWDEAHALFQHAPESVGTTEFFWGRGNGWALVALTRAAESLDAPYTGGRYDTVMTRDDIHELLRAAAESLIARRTPDGGWGSYLSKPGECPVAETSATGLLTFFLARGVNEGWLEQDVYEPVVMRAIALLLQRIDVQGNVSGIQPPDVGPGCGKTASNNGAINVNYGPGAVLLAVSEVLKFPAVSGVSRGR